MNLFTDVLNDWWPKYEAAKHADKRVITREVIKDMYERGVRFVVKVDDGTRHGYYTVEPKGSVRVERKVLRSLREEVLNHTDPSRLNTKKVDTPVPSKVDTPVPSKVEPVKVRKVWRKQTTKKATPVKAKARRKVESSVKRTITKQEMAKPNRSSATGMRFESKYIPILPSSHRPQEYSKFVVPPQLELPSAVSNVPMPPTMGLNTSLGSLAARTNQVVPQLHLIPSAINFGTSDIAGQAPKTSDIATISPDTVLMSDYLSFLNNSFGTGMFPQGQESLLPLPGIQAPPLQSTASFDFKGIFDDAAVDNAMNEVEAAIFPPVFAGRQSSLFSAVCFKELYQNQKDFDSYPEYQQRTGTNPKQENDIYMPAVVPAGIGDPEDFVHFVTTAKTFDHSTIFDEDMMPEITTPKYHSVTNEVGHFARGNMPQITPQDKGYNPERSSHKTPTRSNAKRSISDDFGMGETDTYRELCHKLEDSMAKLENEESQHRSWEAHNEGLWRHFIQEQPDLANMLLARGGRNSGHNEISVPTTTVHLPPRSTTTRHCGSSVSSTFDSRTTSPVPWWFYHDHNISCDNSCGGHPSTSVKWQQLFSSDIDETWEEI